MLLVVSNSCTGLISVWYKQKPKALLESFYHLGFDVSDTKEREARALPISFPGSILRAFQRTSTKCVQNFTDGTL